MFTCLFSMKYNSKSGLVSARHKSLTKKKKHTISDVAFGFIVCVVID